MKKPVAKLIFKLLFILVLLGTLVVDVLYYMGIVSIEVLANMLSCEVIFLLLKEDITQLIEIIRMEVPKKNKTEQIPQKEDSEDTEVKVEE